MTPPAYLHVHRQYCTAHFEHVLHAALWIGPCAAAARLLDSPHLASSDAQRITMCVRAEACWAACPKPPQAIMLLQAAADPSPSIYTYVPWHQRLRHTLVTSSTSPLHTHPCTLLPLHPPCATVLFLIPCALGIYPVCHNNPDNTGGLSHLTQSVAKPADKLQRALQATRDAGACQLAQWLLQRIQSGQYVCCRCSCSGWRSRGAVCCLPPE